MSKSMKKTTEQKPIQLAIIQPHAAAIDVGSMNMMVSYQDHNGEQKLVEFSAYTSDLKKMGLLLKEAGVKQVAMEATGSYWIAVYELLDSMNIEITLVNARHFKNVNAQKTDVKDAQWLHQLHAHGLLRGSHIAPEQYRELRTYIKERGVFQQQKSDTLNRIQKILTLMNIKIQHIISDIEGISGMNIINKIANGVTDPVALLSTVKIARLKATRDELIKSLEGQYKPHLINVLQKHLKAYEFYKEQMKGYEVLIESLLGKLLPSGEHGSKNNISKKRSLTRKNQYGFNLAAYLEQIAGTDLTAIDGLDAASVLVIISVIGIDMSKWKTAEHFASWLNVSPRMKISGGKILGHQSRFSNNMATQAFRLAAQCLWNNRGPLGNIYRRLCASKGSKKAIKAVARKLAVIFYNMLKNKTKYDPHKVTMDDEKYKIMKLKKLQKEAAKLGYTVTVAA